MRDCPPLILVRHRSEHSLGRDTTHIEATQAEAAELAVEGQETELADALPI